MRHNFFESKYYNKPIIESENFLVIPSLGSLIEGWLLIVPKKYHLNISQLSLADMVELEMVIAELGRRFLSMVSKDQFVIFEHGPTLENSVAGCGVDYAHLHWVPTNFDLLNGVKAFLNLDYTWELIHGLNDINNFNIDDEDYLYLRNQKGEHYLTCQKHIPSQTFRKVIAHYLNIPDSYDWKLNQQAQNIRSVYAKLKLHQL
jgi:ATP adenylyltransferase